MGTLFTTFIVQPIFNLLLIIYTIIPTFGFSIIIFTIIVRLFMWPLIKKQLHQSRAMQKMQPELAKIKKKYKNNRQAQGLAMVELYKKHNIKPMASIGVLLIQLPILIAMYQVVRIFVEHRDEIAQYTYDFLKHLEPVKQLIEHPDNFNQTFFGMDLTLHPGSAGGMVSVGLLMIVCIAVGMQYLITRQISPQPQTKRRMRDILAEASQGKEADQSEINAIVMRRMNQIMPIFMFFIFINLPGALALYLATGNIMAYVQNSIILGKDETELMQIAEKKPAKKTAATRAKQATEARVTRIKAKD